MKVSEAALLKSGFSRSELQKIKNNVERYGGNLEEAINDLANRFRIVLWVFYGCIAILVWVTLTSHQAYIVSTSVSLLITMLIVIFVQPPVLSYKSWRYCRMHRASGSSGQ